MCHFYLKIQNNINRKSLISDQKTKQSVLQKM